VKDKAGVVVERVEDGGGGATYVEAGGGGAT